MTEILSRSGAAATPGLTLLRLDDLPGLDEATLETLRGLARPRAGLALLVLTGGADESPRPEPWLAHLTAGLRAAQRTGDHDGHLDRAWALAEDSGDAQRMVQVACARAEAAWLSGRAEDLRAEAHRGWQLATEHADPWALGELAWWLTRAGRAPSSPVPFAAPYRAMLDGDWHTAADIWLADSRPLWAAYALGHSPTLPDARRALGIADQLGAGAARCAITRHRRAAGLPVPLRPRSATRANPAQLTPRELEILLLLTDGLTNRQIATRLYLSERTVAHHVSAVLRKLDQPNRSAAVATAVRRGIVRLPRSVR